jgi:Uma2 family endonuclease
MTTDDGDFMATEILIEPTTSPVLQSKKQLPNIKKVTKELSLPPLENGDRLTRGEFERRYDAMPEIKKAELIEGMVYMSSPVRYKSHGKPHGQIMTWLGVYVANTFGIDLSDNATLRLDPDNDPQPDAILRIEENCGGKSYISDDDYLEGVPELIVEIAASTASYDLNEKMTVYRRNGIQEYVVWRVYDKEIDWFVLQDERYVRLKPNKQGVIESKLFAGLRLNVKAMLEDNLAKVLSDLQEGINSKAHAVFVKKLKSKKEKERIEDSK